jgi:hypothetical protein
MNRLLTASALVALVGVAALAAGCRRTPLAPPAPPPVTTPIARRPHLAPPPFTHPLFAGRVAEPIVADCSRATLTRLVERVRTVDKNLQKDLQRHRTADRDAGLDETRSELLPQAASCVGHDTPLDVPWEMLHSAILSLEICADARQKPDERVRRCRRALEIAGRAERGG